MFFLFLALVKWECADKTEERGSGTVLGLSERIVLFPTVMFHSVNIKHFLPCGEYAFPVFIDSQLRHGTRESGQGTNLSFFALT